MAAITTEGLADTTVTDRQWLLLRMRVDPATLPAHGLHVRSDTVLRLKASLATSTEVQGKTRARSFERSDTLPIAPRHARLARLLFDAENPAMLVTLIGTTTASDVNSIVRKLTVRSTPHTSVARD